MLLSTSELVKKHNLWAKKSFGQNFIFDKNFTDKVVHSVGDITNCKILEIGPGPGSLTRSILQNPIKKLITVEKDERFLPLLAEFKERYQEKLEVIHDDALLIDETKIFSDDFKIIANLPYNIGTVLLIKWLKLIANKNVKISSMTLMLQKEVAERIVAKVGDKNYGRLAVMVDFCCDAKISFLVSKSVFTPPPKVTSAILQITPRQNFSENINFNRLEKIVAAAFGQRRKMIKSALKSVFTNVDEALKIANINPQARAEELSTEQFCTLAKIKYPPILNS